ncbi:glycosyltransferase [Sphingomonas melonis]|uniref:glycosyltransferase n=1 Tax=Sphingomonas melonis TaxID=152682 RepID=UPI001F1D70E3|nr:glycosyltransferase [Sphingomonas melonis]
MACGLPVAAFDMGAAREVVGDAGRFAPPGDVAALATAMREAMAIPPTSRATACSGCSRTIAGSTAAKRSTAP